MILQTVVLLTAAVMTAEDPKPPIVQGPCMEHLGGWCELSGPDCNSWCGASDEGLKCKMSFFKAHSLFAVACCSCRKPTTRPTSEAPSCRSDRDCGTNRVCVADEPTRTTKAPAEPQPAPQTPAVIRRHCVTKPPVNKICKRTADCGPETDWVCFGGLCAAK